MKEIPIVGLGTWQLTGNKCIKAIKDAINIGYKHIDTAELYENESEVGKAIKEIERSKLWITSKVWFANLNFDDVIEACNKSLKKLEIDYLDLYLIHWPNKTIDLNQTFKALKKLVDENKIKNVGVSNFTIRHLKDAIPIARKHDLKIYCNQVEFHPLLYQKNLLEFCNENDIKLVAYSPLGHGKTLNNDVIKMIAKNKNITPAQVCLKWAIQKDIIVIPKSSNHNRLVENFCLDFNLSEKEMKLLDNLPNQTRFINPGMAEFDYM